jgi:ubiquinone/menaquinone biosynthesis C-methylase UbiE
MLQRTLEPEVMDTPEEAADYDAMDHAEVNTRFCEDLLAFAPRLRGRVLDVGTGTALIPIALAGLAPHVHVDALDLSEQMLILARKNIAAAGLSSRITPRLADAKGNGAPDATYDAVISNSIVHHIPDPSDMLKDSYRVLRRGGAFFVRDLHRPHTAEDALRLVEQYAPLPTGDAETIARHMRQRDLFHASLHAALTVEEVQAIVAPLGVPPEAVRKTSDRHWTIACLKA